jgi:transcriptional regulator with GAF, ATPase, and Fis domain
MELGKQVTEPRDLDTTYKRIWHAVRKEMNFDRLGIYIYDKENNSMHGTYGTNNQGEMIAEFDQHVLLSDPTIETESFTTALKEEDGFYFTHQYDVVHNIQSGHIMDGVKDYAAVAAWAGNKPVAVLCVDNAISQNPITEEQLEALRLFAGYAGLAIENSRLKDALKHELVQQKYAEEKEASRRVMLEKVVQLGKRVTEVADLRTTVERIWHAVHDDLEFDRLAIFLYNSEKKVMDDT